MPSPLTFAAAVAACTSQMRLTVVLILPLHDPALAAEQTLVVDQLSNGRIEIVVGLGYVRSEYRMFDLDPVMRVKILEAKLPVYRAALTGRSFERNGRTIRCTPWPVQETGPTVYLSASVPAAARRAARLADGMHCLVRRNALEPHYLDERRRLGLGMGVIEGGQGSPASLFVSDDPERSWDELGPYLLHEANAYSGWAAGNNANQHIYQPIEDQAELRRSPMYKVLTVDEAVEHIMTVENLGLWLNPLVGGLPPAIGFEYFERFLRHVLPRVGDAVAMDR